MLWSPNEVLAYVKDEKPSYSVDKREADRLVPTAPYGGFKIWSNNEEDFILFAENSEIHGPNPLFTIPKLDSKVDLNLLSTQILSADYQGLGNNKILPGKNAQLLMPDIASDTHVAIVYFFLFDSEARGFVRPTCLAYFTSDKNKLASMAEPILKSLTQISSILQHFNVGCTVEDLKCFKNSIASNRESPESKPNDVMSELQLQSIQEVLQIIEGYEGNEVYDEKLSHLINLVKSNVVSEEVQSWISTPLEKAAIDSSGSKLSCRPNAKIHMKDLYNICDKGIVLALYHAFITHEFFRRKYENIICSENISASKEDKCLFFGACVIDSNSQCQSYPKNKCVLKPKRVPSTLSLKDEDYFKALSSSFETTLHRFINWGQEHEVSDAELPSTSIRESTDSVKDASVGNVNYVNPKVEESDEMCSHVTSLGVIWDTLDYMDSQYPDVEKAFLKVLKLFDNSQGLLFSSLTHLPIIVISSPPQFQEAVHFVTALSLFIPRNRRDPIFVDVNRKEPLTEEDLMKYIAVNICVDKQQSIENFIPVDLLPKMCILNLKDCSLTTPSYSGHILTDVDQRIRVLPEDGPIYLMIVGLLAEVERTVNWWRTLTSTSVANSDVSSYVLSKGYTRSDMQIIEKLSKLQEG